MSFMNLLQSKSVREGNFVTGYWNQFCICFQLSIEYNNRTCRVMASASFGAAFIADGLNRAWLFYLHQ